MKNPFLLLQLRPEDDAADNEYDAFLEKGGLRASDVVRIRMEAAGLPRLSARSFAGIIVGGGASNVSDAEEDKPAYQQRFERDLGELLSEVVAYDVPYLGTCYGFGALVRHQGGVVSKEQFGEKVGTTLLRKTGEASNDPLTRDLPESFKAFVGHKEACQSPPPDATHLLTSDACPVQMFRIKNNVYAAQFHPELDTEGIVLRINVYKHAGYFPPEEAEQLISDVSREDVFAPESLLRNFVRRYRS